MCKKILVNTDSQSPFNTITFSFKFKSTLKAYFYFLSPMAEQAAMRDVLRYVKGRGNGRDRWADGRAGGYAGGK